MHRQRWTPEICVCTFSYTVPAASAHPQDVTGVVIVQLCPTHEPHRPSMSPREVFELVHAEQQAATDAAAEPPPP